MAVRSVVLGFVCLMLSVPVQAERIRKATEGSAAVRGKLYKKRKKIELNGPDVGLIMNQSFVSTILVHGGLTYFTSEEFGWQVEGSFGINSDKDERKCIEAFYNNPQQVALSTPCLDEDVAAQNSQLINFGPAYVPIREINLLLAANMVYSPVYGKQLLFLSSVIHFDFFLTIGGGLAMSDFYEKRSEVIPSTGTSAGTPRSSRDGGDNLGETPDARNIGCPVGDTACYGELGRPEVQSQSNPYLNLGVGQKLHFGKLMHAKLELRNMTLLGTHSGFENLFAVWAGVGFRF